MLFGKRGRETQDYKTTRHKTTRHKTKRKKRKKRKNGSCGFGLVWEGFARFFSGSVAVRLRG
jgi:hypothetical protein